MSNDIVARLILDDKFTARLKHTMRGMDSFFSRLRSMNALFSGAAFFYVSARAISSITKANIEMTALKNQSIAAFGAFADGKRQLTYITDESERLGINLKATSQSYSMFATSALQAGISLKQVQEIFRNVSEAAVSVQMPTERFKLVLYALQQIASKGRVSMEELSRQLGESMPGAMAAGAKAMNKTLPEFMKLVSLGRVTSAEFLLPFSRQIKEMLGGNLPVAIKMLQADLERFGNQWFTTKAQAGKLIEPAVQGSVVILTNALKALSEYLERTKNKYEELNNAAKIDTSKNKWLLEATGWYLEHLTVLGMIELAYRSLVEYVLKKAPEIGIAIKTAFSGAGGIAYEMWERFRKDAVLSKLNQKDFYGHLISKGFGGLKLIESKDPLGTNALKNAYQEMKDSRAAGLEDLKANTEKEKKVLEDSRTAYQEYAEGLKKLVPSMGKDLEKISKGKPVFFSPAEMDIWKTEFLPYVESMGSVFKETFDKDVVTRFLEEVEKLREIKKEPDWGRTINVEMAKIEQTDILTELYEKQAETLDALKEKHKEAKDAITWNWMDMANTVEGVFRGFYDSLFDQEKSWGDRMKDLKKSLFKGLIDLVYDYVKRVIMSQIALGVAERANSRANTAAKISEATANAVVSGTKAGSSVASTPYVGPALAIAAFIAVMAVMIAGISKAKAARSYSTGTSNHPGGGAIIHARETAFLPDMPRGSVVMDTSNYARPSVNHNSYNYVFNVASPTREFTADLARQIRRGQHPELADALRAVTR